MIKNILSIIIIIFSASIQAHHSRAMFNSHITELTGSISKAKWRNPHVYFEIDVISEDNKTITWVLESGSVALLARSGWTENTLKLGDRVTAIVNTHKDESKYYAALINVSLPNGDSITTAELTEADTNNINPSIDFSGTWTTAVPENKDGTVGNEALSGPSHWPLTPKGKLQVESFDASKDPMFKCIFYGVPRLAASVYSRRLIRESDKLIISR